MFMQGLTDLIKSNKLHIDSIIKDIDKEIETINSCDLMVIDMAIEEMLDEIYEYITQQFDEALTCPDCLGSLQQVSKKLSQQDIEYVQFCGLCGYYNVT